MIPLRDDNPSRVTPVVTFSLIGACVLAFLWQLSLGPGANERAVYMFGVIPAVLFHEAELPESLAVIPPFATVFSSMFLHGGFMHLAGNMLYLWIFADNVEDSMGHTRFIVFYFLCGIAAAMAQAVPEPSSQVPMIGASGAISGVLGAYMLLFPRARVLLGMPLGFVIVQLGRFPAIWVLAAWFLMQLAMGTLSATRAPDQGGIAFGAHIGGFIAGLILVALFKRRGVPLWRRY